VSSTSSFSSDNQRSDLRSGDRYFREIRMNQAINYRELYTKKKRTRCLYWFCLQQGLKMGFDAEKYWKSPAYLPRSLTKHEIGLGPVLLCNNSNFYFKLISTEGGLGIEYKILIQRSEKSLRVCAGGYA